MGTLYLTQERPLSKEAFSQKTFLIDQIIRSQFYEIGILRKDIFFRQSLSKQEGALTIFGRTRGAIGMEARNCHPPKSLHLVDRILADFKAGRRDVAEFWIDMGGRMVHIRYWPVRGDDGSYLGTLETVQDVTAIRKLEGERRLLDTSA